MYQDVSFFFLFKNKKCKSYNHFSITIISISRYLHQKELCQLVELAEENKVHIIVLPPHTTHKLQQLDVAVFASVKDEWKKVMAETLQSNNYEGISKEIFPSLLKEFSMKRSVRNHHLVFQASRQLAFTL